MDILKYLRNPNNQDWREIRNGILSLLKRLWVWSRGKAKHLSTLASVVIAGAGVFIAIQANEIASSQTEILRYQTELMNQANLPRLDIAIEDSESGDGEGDVTLDVVLYNYGGPVTQVDVAIEVGTIACPVQLSIADVATPRYDFEDITDRMAAAAGRLSRSECRPIILGQLFQEVDLTGLAAGEIARFSPEIDINQLNRIFSEINNTLLSSPLPDGRVLQVEHPSIAVDVRYEDFLYAAHDDRFVASYREAQIEVDLGEYKIEDSAFGMPWKRTMSFIEYLTLDENTSGQPILNANIEALNAEIIVDWWEAQPPSPDGDKS